MAIIELENGERPGAVPLAQTACSILPMNASAVYERVGPFEIRLAADARDVKRAQRLRYSVFYKEGRAIPDLAVAETHRDLCPFDAICDHLIVLDTEAKSPSGVVQPRVVGTYRLLRRDMAELHDGFYSQSEFELSPLLEHHPNARFLELGRSCVHPEYRSKRVIELLWRGLWLYARHYAVDALIGCASLPGIDLEPNRLPLSFLHHYARAEPEWQVAPLPQCEVTFTPLAKALVDVRRGLQTLPPLVKAYLRTGARFSTGAVLDRQFGTTDVFTVMPMADIEERYLTHYGQPSCVSGVPVA